MITYLKYFLKSGISELFFLLGGVYWLKYFFLKKSVLFILNYHNFSKYNNYKIKRGNILETGYANNFEKQIRFYKKHFNFCYPEDFFAGKCDKCINVLITFDDGYRDNYDIALPILKKHDAAAVFFITTNAVLKNDYLLHDKIRYLIQKGLITEKYNKIPTEMYKGSQNYKIEDVAKVEKTFNEKPPNKRLMMTPEEVKELSDNGFVIGNHTHSHLALSFFSKEEQKVDILNADKNLSYITRKSIKHIAYPNGLNNENTRRALVHCNYAYGYTINGGPNDENTDKFLLRRIGLNASDSIGNILLKMFLYSTIKKGKI